MNLID
ncbi:putative membrane protein, partial [Vibrio harveyi]